MGGYDLTVGNADHDVFLNNTLSSNVVELQLQFRVSEVRSQNNIFFNPTSGFLSGSTTGLTQTTNLTRAGAACATCVNPTAPPDLHTVGALASQVVDQGTPFSCPSTWSCPAVWGAPLEGALDASGSPRVKGTAIDLGAWEP